MCHDLIGDIQAGSTCGNPFKIPVKMNIACHIIALPAGKNRLTTMDTRGASCFHLPALGERGIDMHLTPGYDGAVVSCNRTAIYYQISINGCMPMIVPT